MVLEDEGRSQVWLARKVGVSKNMVGLWVHGIYTPTVENREAIAGALGRSVAELWPVHGVASDHTTSQSNQSRLENAA